MNKQCYDCENKTSKIEVEKLEIKYLVSKVFLALFFVLFLAACYYLEIEKQENRVLKGRIELIKQYVDFDFIIKTKKTWKN